MKLTQRLRKSLTSGLMAAMIFSVTNVHASTPVLLDQVKHTQTITKGAEYITDSRLTDKGWQDLHILKIDLDDPNIQVRPIESNNIGEKETVLSLAQKAGAVAGVNADFFDMGSKKSPGFGIVIDEGEINHAYNNKIIGLGASKNMGTMLIDKDNNVLLDFFNVNLVVEDSRTGQVLATLSAVNKPTGNLNSPAYLDRKYGTSTAPLESGKKLYKVVVENDKVTKIIGPGQTANIPENGYILIMDEAGAKLRLDAIYVGQEVKFQTKLSLGTQFQKTIDDIEAGIGGGGLIMKDGATYTGATHKVSPNSRHPRTVVGSSEDGKTLYLITIDGRGGSIGATHNDLIPILKSYGIHTAMYLDGGGSTTFVSREEGETEVKIKNKPSGGSPRRVPNGIGVFSTSAPGQVAKIIISSQYDRTYMGTPISYKVKALDQNNNPVSINKDQISWETEGVTGDWWGNTFYPSSSGSGLVIAKINDVEIAKPIKVSEKPVGIQIAPSLSVIKVGESVNLTILGTDEDGQRAPVAHDQIQWSVDSGAAAVNEGKIKGIKNGQAVITASLKSDPTIKTQISTVVGTRTQAVDSLDRNNAAVWDGSNSPAVTGRVEPCKTLKYHGSSSVKFIYNLAKTPNKQVAYMRLTSPIKINPNVQSIGMWVYGNGQGDMLKVELANGAGKKYALQAGEINFKGWKYLSIPIPKDITEVVNLQRMYTITYNNNKARTSSLYIDHISVTYGTRDRNASYLKGHEKFDPMHQSLKEPAGEGAYEFTLSGTTKMNHYPLDTNMKNRVANGLKQDAEFTVLTGNTDLGIKSLLPNNTVWENKFSTYEFNNTQVIHLGTNSGGVVKTNPGQWKDFKNALNNSKCDHIIITMNKDPFSTNGFKDAREGALFHDILAKHVEATGKNVVVAIADGYDTDVYIRDGVRYMYTNGLMTVDDNIGKANKVRFRISGDEMKYSIEPVL
ncbi:MAG: hypothetical protein GX366_06155 [Epulopiscium sp.]|nr:hypothetical protein [Candidatus Epulonipiscium sp.]